MNSRLLCFILAVGFCDLGLATSSQCFVIYRELTGQKLKTVERGQALDREIKDLHARAQRGDRAAQTKLTEILIAIMFPAIVYRANQEGIKDKNVYMDVLHDLLLKSPRLIENAETHVGAYLYAAAKTELADHVRDWNRQRIRGPKVFNMTDVKEKDTSKDLRETDFRRGGFATEAEPWMKMMASEFGKMLEHELERFPTTHQKVFLLRHQGKTVQEVAHQLGLQQHKVYEIHRLVFQSLRENSLENIEGYDRALSLFPEDAPSSNP